MRTILFLAIAVMAFLLFVIVDAVGSNYTHPIATQVAGKQYVEAWMETQYICVPDGNGGLTMTPNFVWHPEEWRVTVLVDGDPRSALTSESFWRSLNNGDSVFVRYSAGWMTGWNYGWSTCQLESTP